MRIIHKTCLPHEPPARALSSFPGAPPCRQALGKLMGGTSGGSSAKGSNCSPIQPRAFLLGDLHLRSNLLFNALYVSHQGQRSSAGRYAQCVESSSQTLMEQQLEKDKHSIVYARHVSRGSWLHSLPETHAVASSLASPAQACLHQKGQLSSQRSRESSFELNVQSE